VLTFQPNVYYLHIFFNENSTGTVGSIPLNDLPMHSTWCMTGIWKARISVLTRISPTHFKIQQKMTVAYSHLFKLIQCLRDKTIFQIQTLTKTSDISKSFSA